MRYRLTAAALAIALAAMACSDAPTTSPLRPFEGILRHTVLEDFIQAAIDRYLPKGFESAVEARWATVKRKKAEGDMAGAVAEFNRLSLWIQKKTGEITIPTGETVTKQQAAALIIVNMGRYLYEGADADPLAVPTGDVAVAYVPAGEPLALVVPSLHAGVSWDAGATSEDRVVVIVEDAGNYPAQCQGPLPTNLCQYPLFYKFESFPDVRLNTPGRAAVCMVTTGDRRPLEYLEDEEPGVHGPVGERLRLAHNLPPVATDRHPQGIVAGQIEILPLSATQSDLVRCNEPSTLGMGTLEKTLYVAMRSIGRLIAPKDAWAYDLGPEHEFTFFSNFNAVDPESGADLAVESVSGTTTVAPNGTASVSYQIVNRSRRNDGDATGTAVGVIARAYLSTDQTLDAGDALLGSASLGTLVPDAPAQPVSHNDFTVSATGGTRYVLISVEQTGGLDEITLANNSAVHAITVTTPTVGSVLFGVESGTDGLSVINPATGATTFVGRLDANTSVFTTPVAMTTDPTSGTLYVWNNSDPAGVLLTVNVCTGSATQVGTASNIVSGALAASPAGQLYLLGQPASSPNLFTVNKATGALTQVAPLTINAFAAEFDPQTGTLYAVEWTTAATTLYTVNVTTGAATAVGQLPSSLGVIGSIVFTASGTLIGSAFGGTQGNTLFDIDRTTGAVSNIRQGGGGTQGMGFASACVIIE